MKSVGEAMSLAQLHRGALGKVMRSLETTKAGFWTVPDNTETDVAVDEVLDRLRTPPMGASTTSNWRCGWRARVDEVARASG